MGRFLISRDEAGVCFCLQAENGRRLATSRTYATLDACKKGIASLIANAPTVPLVDSTAGERAPNPKIEIVAAAAGIGFVLKSANGKSVLTSPAYATKKACLRAVSMLRLGVQNAEVVMVQSAGLVPVVMTAHMAAVGIEPVLSAPPKESEPSAPVCPFAAVEACPIPLAPLCEEEEAFALEETALADTASEEPFAAAPCEKAPVARPITAQKSPAPAAKSSPAPRAPSSNRGAAAKNTGTAKKKTVITAKNVTLAFKKTSRELVDLILKRK